MSKSLRFKFFSGDTNWKTYGGTFLSKRLNNGEFDYWLALDVVNWADAVGEKDAPAKYNVSIRSVSIEEGKNALEEAFSCCGFDIDEIESATEEQKIDALLSYGTMAELWSENGNNINTLMKRAKQEALMIEMMYGFYMDRPVNRIGNTGWDSQRGDIGFK